VQMIDLPSGVARRRPWTFTVGAAIAATVVFTLLFATSAFAARGHVFKEAFGVPCTTATCAEGELKEPSAVAVNEATGEVYVLDQGNERIARFDGATGAYLGGFDGSASFEPQPGVVEPTTPTPAGSFEFGVQPQVSGIAVDNSCSLEGLTELTTPTCAAFDPSNEDVYVIDARHNVVDKFKSDGEYLGQIKEADGEPLVELGGVAVERSGALDLYQIGGEGNGRVDLFDNALTNAQTGTVGPILGRTGNFSAGIAVDSEGNFYLRGCLSTCFIEKYAPTGHQLTERLDEQDSTGVAADLKTNDAYVDNLTTLAAFSPSGSELQRLGEEGGVNHLVQGAGVAADAFNESLYVADSGAGQVVVFEIQQPGPPEIVSEGVLDISADAATFEAELNPRSEVGASPTAYTFEYGPCAAGVLTCAGSPFTSASAAASLAADFEIHRVTSVISGLQPNVTYHYRLSAQNAQSTGPTLGPEKIFVTQTSGAALTLPDFRAWELVSPAHKEGASIEPISETGVVQAADDGDAISYTANAATEPQPQGTGVSGFVQVLSTRGSAGWGSQDLATPHQTATGVPAGPGGEYRDFSADLSFAFVNPQGAFEPAISPEATEGTAFRRSDYLNGDPAQQCIARTMSCYQPLVTAASGLANVPEGTPFGRDCAESNGNPCGPLFQNATPDGSHAVMKSEVPLTGTPIPGEGLYEWSAGSPPIQQLALISVLPGEAEQAIEKPRLGYLNRSMRNAISSNGSRVVFSEGGSVSEAPKRLFLRDTSKRETIQLDAAEPGCLASLQCESGAGHFQTASSDGSRIFFTDSRRLTADAGADPVRLEPDLYECRIVEEPSGHLACDLTDLTPEVAGESADVLGAVIGASDDGSSIAFVANGVLTGVPDSQGEQARAGGCSEVAPAGATCNLYLIDEGQTSLLTVLSNADSHDWRETLEANTTRLSPDGRWLAFMSERRLTDFDNRDAATDRPTAEVYVFDATAGRLLCASCDPSGARPRGVPYDQIGIAGNEIAWSARALVAANVPGWIGNDEAGGVARHQSRYLSDSGRLLFNTVNALVPQDSNGTQDVYEYEPPGVGSCTTSSPTYGEQSEGCVSLISSGSSSQESAFLDASENGGDVFFLTSARLAPKDIDTARDVYDARVGGGEAEVVTALPCSGDACQQTSAPPGEANPGSLEFQGPGNTVQCRKGQVKKGGKCVKKKSAKKKHHKNSKHHKKPKNRHDKSKGGAGK
jgi:DNA-binding beta-propeller fold protein YncE